MLILGGGKVGEAAADALERRGLPFCLVEKNPRLVPPDDPRYILGNAGELAVLQRAHIMETPSVIVTTHDDDLNIYLTIYCRKLRPDVQILSRSTLDRNVPSLYNAGANLVMSHASMESGDVARFDGGEYDHQSAQSRPGNHSDGRLEHFPGDGAPGPCGPVPA